MATKITDVISEEIELHYTVPEFAVVVKYRPSTIRKKLYERSIAYKKVGRHVLIPRSEARRLLQNNFPVIEK